MEWTLETRDPEAGWVAGFIRTELPDISPITMVLDLERDDTTTIESDYAVLKCNPSIQFPARSKKLSLPVLIFNVLFGPPVHMCFVWARLMEVRRIEPDSLNKTQRALFLVGSWYANIASNPPIVDLAIMVERCDLRVITARFAYLLRCITGSLVDSNREMRDVFRPWNLRSTTPFYSAFKKVVHRASIVLRFVELGPEGAARVQPGSPPMNADFVFDGTVGIICCPVDKVILAAVLFLSTEVGLVRRANPDPKKFAKDWGVPEQLTSLLTLFVKGTSTKIDPPPYLFARDADHHRSV